MKLIITKRQWPCKNNGYKKKSIKIKVYKTDTQEMTKIRWFGKILDDLEDKAQKKSNRTDCGKIEKLVD
jgi:hypothetical protein